MTIAIDNYFAKEQPVRKKEPQYLAVIDKDSCTSCNACATVCPVDCIYEVVSGTPSQSYHVIDSSRCIGCQLCYRIPSESTDRYTLELCPWNAIDMLHNPNKTESTSVLQRYYLGNKEFDGQWHKLDEYGFQLAMNGEVILHSVATTLTTLLDELTQTQWGHGDDVRQLAQRSEGPAETIRFVATYEGKELLDVAFADYENVFLD